MVVAGIRIIYIDSSLAKLRAVICNLCYIVFPPWYLFVFMFVLQLCGERYLSDRRRCGYGCLLSTNHTNVFHLHLILPL